MPAKRDYKREERLQGKAGRMKDRAARNRARYAVLKRLTAKHGATKAKQMLEGKDIGHIKSLAVGGSNKPLNLKIQDRSENRSDKKMFKGRRTTRPSGGGRK